MDRETSAVIDAARSGDHDAIRAALAEYERIKIARDAEPRLAFVPAVAGLVAAIVMWRGTLLFMGCVASVVLSSLIRSWRVWRARRQA